MSIKIEFPSVLLPPDICSGSIVDVNVSRNLTAEAAEAESFSSLQSTIFQNFGLRTPSPPLLRCRNATQTSVVLEWDTIQLAKAELRSLSLYRNGSKAGSIPRPMDMQSTKISGLAVDTEYVFHLVLRTSAGTFTSEKLHVWTHKMTDLSGITVSPGIMPAALKKSLAGTIEKIGARLIETVRIDTTHFVCTEGRGPEWEKALEMNIPVVVPDWIKGCEREGRIVGVRGYYLNADPRLRQVGPNPSIQQPPLERRESVPQTPRTEVTPPTPERQTAEEERVVESNDVDYGKPAPPPKEDGEHEGGAASEEATSEEEDDDDVDAEKSEHHAEHRASSGSTTLAERPKSSVKDATEDEGSFQDVAL